MSSRWRDILRTECGGWQPRLWLVQALAACLPGGMALRLRTRVYRLAGLQIGRGTVLSGRLRLTGSGPIVRRLAIGSGAYLNERIVFDLGAPITLEDGVSLGMECLLLTQTHAFGGAAFRAGAGCAAPIRIGRGCWLGARVTVLPGVTIGAGSVVAAGAVVARDLPPNVLAGGVPARVLRTLEEGAPAERPA